MAEQVNFLAIWVRQVVKHESYSEWQILGMTIVQNDTYLEWCVSLRSYFGHGVLSRLIPQLKLLLLKNMTLLPFEFSAKPRSTCMKTDPLTFDPITFSKHKWITNIGSNHVWTTSHPRYEIDHLATRCYLPLTLNSLIGSCMVEHYLIFFLNKFIYYDVDGTFCLLATIVSRLFSINSESFLQKLNNPSTINTDMT